MSGAGLCCEGELRSDPPASLRFGCQLRQQISQQAQILCVACSLLGVKAFLGLCEIFGADIKGHMPDPCVRNRRHAQVNLSIAMLVDCYHDFTSGALQARKICGPDVSTHQVQSFVTLSSLAYPSKNAGMHLLNGGSLCLLPHRIWQVSLGPVEPRKL